jgi:hypothetical protein
MRRIKGLAVVAAICSAALVSVGCGGDSPFAATSVNGSNIVLRGTVLNLVPALAVGFSASSTSAVGFSASSTSADSEITVMVAGHPEITTTVDSEGRFVLRGLPEGSFTLLFQHEGGDPGSLGSLDFEDVLPNQELTVSVELMSDGTVMLVEEQRNGIGHAGLEIQGSIDEVMTLNPIGDSVFVISGYEVVVRPGVTAIRENNTRLSVEELALAVGGQAHVKGVWIDPEVGMDAADQQVLAHEIKLQDPNDLDGEKVTICHKGKKTISVGADAVAAHLAHGDTVGLCR